MKNKTCDGFQKVYKRNGLNCVDGNNGYTYLPDDLSKVGAIQIDGEFYVPYIIVKL